MSELKRIGLLGSGSWATALAKMLCENVEELNWWIRSEDTIQHIENFGSNPKYIQSIQFPTDKLKLSSNMREVISASDVVIVAIPSMYIDEAFDEAFSDEAPVEMNNKLFFSASTSDDVFGAELAAVLKNVYAIGAGLARGLDYGDNFISVLISNAATEMKRFIDTAHDIDRNIKSSPYLGDLLVTAYSVNSRNRTLGMMVGQGYTVKAAVIEMNMVAEGMTGSKGIYEMNKRLNVDMPIAESVYRVLHERMSPILEMRLLSDLLK